MMRTQTYSWFKDRSRVECYYNVSVRQVCVLYINDIRRTTDLDQYLRGYQRRDSLPLNIISELVSTLHPPFSFAIGTIKSAQVISRYLQDVSDLINMLLSEVSVEVLRTGPAVHGLVIGMKSSYINSDLQQYYLIHSILTNN